ARKTPVGQCGDAAGGSDPVGLRPQVAPLAVRPDHHEPVQVEHPAIRPAGSMNPSDSSWQLRGPATRLVDQSSVGVLEGSGSGFWFWRTLRGRSALAL